MQRNRNMCAMACLSLCLLVVLPITGRAFSGTFTVTETWSATLTYSNWGGGNFSGTQTFGGTQTGSIVVTGNSFTMLNQTGIPHTPPPGTSMARVISSGGGFSISGAKVMPYILAGADLNAILYLSGFMVTVKLVDGEIPVFNSFAAYNTSGSSMSAMSGSGNMVGSSLRITATSTSTWTPVAMPPNLVANPASQIINLGTPATFGVSVVGSPTLTYQWRRNGTNLAGATAATYGIASVQTNHAGEYRVVVGNSFGSTTSAPAILTVNIPGIPPSIVGQPQSQAVNPGANVSFAVNATGTFPLYYQWQREGTNIAKATNTTLTLNSVSFAQAGNYRVMVSNNVSSATSAVATLTVGVPPVITVNPQNQTVVAGNSALFFSSATGNPIPGYRWQRKPAGAAVWANLYETAGFLGTATTNLTVTGTVTLMNADQFRCVASSPAGSATSSVATLTVIPVVLPPIILSEAFVEDGNFKFVFSGQAGSAYSVQFNDGFSATPGWQHLLNLVGVGGSILVIDSISNNAARIYRVLVVP